MRLFIGIKTGCDDYLISLQNSLKEVGSGNFTLADNLHLTLKFLGETPPHRIMDIEEAMRRAVGEPLKLELRGAKAFRSGIVSAEVGGDIPALSSLVSRLEDALHTAGFAKEQRPYRPHITLVREWRAAPGLDISAVPHGECRFTADEFILFESTRQAGRLTYVPLYTQKLKRGE